MANEASDRPFLRAHGVPAVAIAACGTWLKFAELGAVSPDIGYLKVGNVAAKAWSDGMHYVETDSVIRHVIAQIRRGGMSEDDRGKALAWLFGYTCHVVMDCTIHPVINLLVGDYATNQTQHRTAEMHQDVHIFGRLGLGVAYSNHLKNGIEACAPDGELDPMIVRLWAEALVASNPAALVHGRPDPASWHKWFTEIVSAIGAGSNVLVAMARHVLPIPGVVYPRPPLENAYLYELDTPAGVKMDFDAIFEKAKGHVAETFKVIARGALDVDREYETVLQHGNLDTGKNRAGKLIFW